MRTRETSGLANYAKENGYGYWVSGPKVSKVHKEFFSVFGSGLPMWTSEDGTMLSIAVLRTAAWPAVLKREFAHVFESEPFDELQGKPKFVERRWIGGEYFDGNSGRTRGKVWFVTEEPTEFPIIDYELKLPR